MIYRSILLISLAALVLLCGCHSACFQTAEIRNGFDATLGFTRVRAADQGEVSDYSIVVKGVFGRSAQPDRIGYSLGLSFIAPFKSRGRSFLGGDEPESGSIPNEWVGVLPEFKMQMPRSLPVDISLNARLMTVYPERIGILASREVIKRFTAYGGYFLNVDIGQLAVGGTEIRLTDTISLMAEYSTWLSDHEYPFDYPEDRRRKPYSLGLALSYHLPRKTEPYDHRPYAHHQKGDTMLFSPKTHSAPHSRIVPDALNGGMW